MRRPDVLMQHLKGLVLEDCEVFASMAYHALLCERLYLRNIYSGQADVGQRPHSRALRKLSTQLKLSCPQSIWCPTLPTYHDHTLLVRNSKAQPSAQGGLQAGRGQLRAIQLPGGPPVRAPPPAAPAAARPCRPANRQSASRPPLARPPANPCPAAGACCAGSTERRAPLWRLPRKSPGPLPCHAHAPLCLTPVAGHGEEGWHCMSDRA